MEKDCHCLGRGGSGGGFQLDEGHNHHHSGSGEGFYHIGVGVDHHHGKSAGKGVDHGDSGGVWVPVDSHGQNNSVFEFDEFDQVGWGAFNNESARS